MKFYSNDDIAEGEMSPTAWIWWGRVLPCHGSSPIGHVLMVRLPWWIRKPLRVWSGQIKDATCQLTFIMEQFEGPETYEWLWLPCESEFYL